MTNALNYDKTATIDDGSQCKCQEHAVIDNGRCECEAAFGLEIATGSCTPFWHIVLIGLVAIVLVVNVLKILIMRALSRTVWYSFFVSFRRRNKANPPPNFNKRVLTLLNEELLLADEPNWVPSTKGGYNLVKVPTLRRVGKLCFASEHTGGLSPLKRAALTGSKRQTQGCRCVA